MPAVNSKSPNYKAQVREFIKIYVEKIVGEEITPKITGILIDLPIPQIKEYLCDFEKLKK